jgi:hypothetical protein
MGGIMEETHLGFRGKIKYEYLYAWDVMMGSFFYYIQENQERAARENAPLDAIYRAQNGVWMTTCDIQSDQTMERLQEIRDRYFADPS